MWELYYIGKKETDFCSSYKRGKAFCTIFLFCAEAMEVVGRKRIFHRLEHLHNLRYTFYIGDGDTKSFEAISKSTLHKKWCFPLRISSVNVTKPEGNCGFGHIYWRFPLRISQLLLENALGMSKNVSIHVFALWTVIMREKTFWR